MYRISIAIASTGADASLRLEVSVWVLIIKYEIADYRGKTTRHVCAVRSGRDRRWIRIGGAELDWGVEMDG